MKQDIGKKQWLSLPLREIIKFYMNKVLKKDKEYWDIEAIDVTNDKIIITKYKLE